MSAAWSDDDSDDDDECECIVIGPPPPTPPPMAARPSTSKRTAVRKRKTDDDAAAVIDTGLAKDVDGEEEEHRLSTPPNELDNDGPGMTDPANDVVDPATLRVRNSLKRFRIAYRYDANKCSVVLSNNEGGTTGSTVVDAAEAADEGDDAGGEDDGPVLDDRYTVESTMPEVQTVTSIDEDGGTTVYEGPLDAMGRKHGVGVEQYVMDDRELVCTGNWVEGLKHGVCRVWLCRRDVVGGSVEVSHMLQFEGEYYRDSPRGFAYERKEGSARAMVDGVPREHDVVWHYIGPKGTADERKVCFCEMAISRANGGEGGRPARRPWQSHRVFFMSLDCRQKYTDADPDGTEHFQVMYQNGVEMSIGVHHGGSLWDGTMHVLMGPDDVDAVRSRSLVRSRGGSGRKGGGDDADRQPRPKPPSGHVRRNGVVVEPMGARSLFVNQVRLNNGAGIAMGVHKGGLLEPGWAWCTKVYEDGECTRETIREPVPIEELRQARRQNANGGGPPKPIRAFFEGRLYASLLELRFSVFLRALGLVAFYEPCTVMVDDAEGTLYTPDFLVVGDEAAQENYMIYGHPLGQQAPEEKRLAARRGHRELSEPRCRAFEPYWVEIKPEDPTKEEMWKMSELVRRTHRDGYIFFGNSVGEPGERKFRGMKAHMFKASSSQAPETPYWYAECPVCRTIDLAYGGCMSLIGCGCDRGSAPSSQEEDDSDVAKKPVVTSRYFSRLLAAYDAASSIVMA